MFFNRLCVQFFILVLLFPSCGNSEHLVQLFDSVGNSIPSHSLFVPDVSPFESEASSEIGINIRNRSDRQLKGLKVYVKGEDADEFLIQNDLNGELPAGATKQISFIVWSAYAGKKRASLQILYKGVVEAAFNIEVAVRPIRRDNDGMIISDEIGVIHPTAVAAHGLRLWNYLVSQKSYVITHNFDHHAINWRSTWRDRAEKRPKVVEEITQIADWFEEQCVSLHNGGCWWPFEFDYPPYGLRAPWASAMTQGQIISLLTRASILTGNQKYIDLARRGMVPFQIDVENGGVRDVDGKGNVFFEEYPSRPKSHVLNGFIFALFGLYDFWIVAKNPESLDLFQQGVQTLKNRIADYDFGHNSNYQLIQPMQWFQLSSTNDSVTVIAVDSIKFLSKDNQDKAFILDVGTNDLSKEWWEARIWGDSAWQASQIMDGRSVRLLKLTPDQKKARVTLRCPNNVDSPGQYSFGVVFKDSFKSKLFIEIFDGVSWVRAGHLQGHGTGEWIEAKVDFNKGLRSGGVNREYMELHIDLLEHLFLITGEGIFRNVAKRFKSYLPTLAR